jgi:hypothetical protein
MGITSHAVLLIVADCAVARADAAVAVKRRKVVHPRPQMGQHIERESGGDNGGLIFMRNNNVRAPCNVYYI